MKTLEKVLFLCFAINHIFLEPIWVTCLVQRTGLNRRMEFLHHQKTKMISDMQENENINSENENKKDRGGQHGGFRFKYVFIIIVFLVNNFFIFVNLCQLKFTNVNLVN